MRSWWRKLYLRKWMGKYQSQVLRTGQLSQADPSMVKVQVRSHYQCVCGGGGYVAGNTKRSGDWGREGHIRVHLNIEQEQSSQPTKEMTNTRPSGLWIWYSIVLGWSCSFVGSESGQMQSSQLLQNMVSQQDWVWTPPTPSQLQYTVQCTLTQGGGGAVTIEKQRGTTWESTDHKDRSKIPTGLNVHKKFWLSPVYKLFMLNEEKCRWSHSCLGKTPTNWPLPSMVPYLASHFVSPWPEAISQVWKTTKNYCKVCKIIDKYRGWESH